jgi:hypothetical protein
MARKLQQIRFSTGSTNPTSSALVSGEAFKKYTAAGIEQLGIQAIPGTKFFLNASPDPVIIGSTGIYELNLTNSVAITNLRFHRDSIETIQNSNGILSLLVDIIYREG